MSALMQMTASFFIVSSCNDGTHMRHSRPVIAKVVGDVSVPGSNGLVPPATAARPPTHIQQVALSSAVMVGLAKLSAAAAQRACYTPRGSQQEDRWRSSQHLARYCLLCLRSPWLQPLRRRA